MGIENCVGIGIVFVHVCFRHVCENCQRDAIARIGGCTLFSICFHLSLTINMKCTLCLFELECARVQKQSNQTILKIETLFFLAIGYRPYQ